MVELQLDRTLPEVWVKLSSQRIISYDRNLRALVAGRSLFRRPLSGTTFLLTSDTAVLSHSSKLLSLLLPTLSYSNPFTALDAILDFMLILLLSSLADSFFFF